MKPKNAKMKKKSLLWMSVLLLMSGMLCACSSDDDGEWIVGEWTASHHSKNPQSYDTDDMWFFTFKADGTGSGPFGTRTFRYEIKGNHITLNLMNVDTYYGQTTFDYKIVSRSKNEMEWDETPNDSWDNSGLYFKFYRVTPMATE